MQRQIDLLWEQIHRLAQAMHINTFEGLTRHRIYTSTPDSSELDIGQLVIVRDNGGYEIVTRLD